MIAALPDSSTSVTLQSVAGILSGLPDHDLAWLSQPEQARLSAIKPDGKRRQFIAGRWLARQCLAGRSGLQWNTYVLSAPDAAAPQAIEPAAGAGSALHFSLSHSGDWLACAVSSEPVGVDVETSDRARDFTALNEWLHRPAALSGWADKSAQEQQDWFYAQWTLKEAWLKQSAGSPGRSSLQDVGFECCKNAAQMQAMTGRNAGLTLAIYPATAAGVQFEGELLETLDWTCWQCS
jgi:4'-phosphopantetheinyl transferase